MVAVGARAVNISPSSIASTIFAAEPLSVALSDKSPTFGCELFLSRIDGLFTALALALPPSELVVGGMGRVIERVSVGGVLRTNGCFAALVVAVLAVAVPVIAVLGAGPVAGTPACTTAGIRLTGALPLLGSNNFKAL